MLQISNDNILTMTRGDAEKFALHIFYGIYDKLTNIPYVPNRFDKVFFAIMEPNQSFEHAIVRKVYDASEAIDIKNGKLWIELDGVDTEFLMPGDYYYCVKLLKKNAWKKTEDYEGRPETIIQKTKLTIVD